MNKVPPQKGEKEKGAGSLGALEHRYGTSKKLAQEATPVALQKATDKKMLDPGKTATGQPADSIVLDPVTKGMNQSQTTM
jgi:hypothetical protein